MNPRLYSIFEKPVGAKRWKRISERAYRKTTAVAVWQHRLLAPFLGMEDNVKGPRMLRPVVK